jgi:hypothetical protein
MRGGRKSLTSSRVEKHSAVKPHLRLPRTTEGRRAGIRQSAAISLSVPAGCYVPSRVPKPQFSNSPREISETVKTRTELVFPTLNQHSSWTNSIPAGPTQWGRSSRAVATRPSGGPWIFRSDAPLNSEPCRRLALKSRTTARHRFSRPRQRCRGPLWFARRAGRRRAAVEPR